MVRVTPLESRIVSNIVGFMSAGGGAGASTLVANIGKLVKKKRFIGSNS